MLAYSEGIYTWIKSGHVLAAIVWVGGGIFIQAYTTKVPVKEATSKGEPAPGRAPKDAK